jgi:DNA-binding PadR family transcriptional regulator
LRGETIAMAAWSMTLTPPQRDLLKKLPERPRGEIALGLPYPEGWEELERAGYITVSSPTRGDLSVLIFKITEAGRRALAAAG